tara:strand:- start:673 stop:873 length:201 start_codon:yes stop_codon:yes gene_type:complete
MAKYELKFIDVNDNCQIEVSELSGVISIYSVDREAKNSCGVCVHLDKSTAIKFAKTLRTEINKIQE